MGIVAKWLFKSVTMGKQGGGGYNLDTGAVQHPPKGKGKSPKVKSRVEFTKSKKGKK